MFYNVSNMSKKIEVSIKNINKLEFTLEQDANKGDYICLSQLSEISFDQLKEELISNKTKILNEIWEKEKDIYISSSEEMKSLKEEVSNLEKQIIKIESDSKSNKENEINEIKILKEKEITELKSEIENIKNNQELSISSAVQKAEAELNNQLHKLESELELKKMNSDQLNKEIEKLKKDYESKIEIQKERAVNDLQKNHDAETKELEKKISSLEAEKKSLKEKHEAETKISLLEATQKIKESLESEIKDRDDKIRELENRRNTLNIKEIGEELEKFIQSEASNNLSYPNTSFRKANENKDGTKPDFIFEILNEDKSTITGVTLEAKSETLNAKTKKKNYDHISKLDSDRNKNGTEYALLVTELEKDDEFIFKKVGEYDNMYMVRPRYFIPFLQLIFNLSQQQKELSSLDINFKDKQDILKEFELFKSGILETTINDISKKIEDINKESEKAAKAINNIGNATRILSTKMSTLENKFNKFKIEKLVEKIK